MKLCIHWYHEIKNTGLHSYQQCRCGKRRIISGSGGYQPVDRDWVRTGRWSIVSPPPALVRAMKPSDAAYSAQPRRPNQMQESV